MFDVIERWQLLTTLSLSSLPSHRKAETESGKLVTVKKTPLIPSIRLDLDSEAQTAAASSTGGNLQPRITSEGTQYFSRTEVYGAISSPFL